MTKKQEAVVRTALELLDEKGADAVSMRGIADRLDVRMNTVLWHAKTKARLLELLADAIVGEIPLTGLPAPWRDRVRELAHRYRRALLAHRDGARVVTGTYAAEPHTLRFADTLVQALLDGGLDHRDAAWTCWTVVYFALGLAQEEQACPEAVGDSFAKALSEHTHPALHRVLPHLEAADSFESRFDFGLTLILDSLPR